MGNNIGQHKLEAGRYKSLTQYSRLSLNGDLYNKATSLKRTFRVGSWGCSSSVIFIQLNLSKDGNFCRTDTMASVLERVDCRTFHQTSLFQRFSSPLCTTVEDLVQAPVRCSHPLILTVPEITVFKKGKLLLRREQQKKSG